MKCLKLPVLTLRRFSPRAGLYAEFLDILKAGTTADCFGFAFANSGVTASDVPNIMGVMAGLTNAFTPDLKYAFTSDNMLNLLNAIEEMTKAGYMPNYAIEAGQRMVMCQQGEYHDIRQGNASFREQHQQEQCGS